MTLFGYDKDEMFYLFGYELTDWFKDWRNLPGYNKLLIIITSPILIPLIETRLFFKTLYGMFKKKVN